MLFISLCLSLACALSRAAPTPRDLPSYDSLARSYPDSGDEWENYSVIVPSDPSDDECKEICALTYMTHAANERDALCSPEGLKATFNCARCIDATWPDTTWEESAMAEYENIANGCSAGEDEHPSFRMNDNL